MFLLLSLLDGTCLHPLLKVFAADAGAPCAELHSPKATGVYFSLQKPAGNFDGLRHLSEGEGTSGQYLLPFFFGLWRLNYFCADCHIDPPLKVQLPSQRDIRVCDSRVMLYSARPDLIIVCEVLRPFACAT
jgi:hypothetical protein